MDEVQKIMEGLVIDDSSYLWYVDLDYEFDACQFYNFSIDETVDEVQEAESWFRYGPEYPRAPYILKINLTNISKNIPAKVHTTSSQKLEADEHLSASMMITPSDRGIPSSEEKSEAGSSDLNYLNIGVDDHSMKAKSMSASRSSKQSRTFMKPTASHLAKQVNSVDIHTGNCGRSGCETEDTKRQKLQIGFLRKVAQLKHQTSFSHKTTTKDPQLDISSNSRSKTTIPQQPKLMTEERALRRSFRSKSKAEADNHTTFKALPLNRKILESPLLPKRKKSMPVHSPVFQKFHFMTSSQRMQRRSANVRLLSSLDFKMQTEENTHLPYR